MSGTDVFRNSAVDAFVACDDFCVLRKTKEIVGTIDYWILVRSGGGGTSGSDDGLVDRGWQYLDIWL